MAIQTVVLKKDSWPDACFTSHAAWYAFHGAYVGIFMEWEDALNALLNGEIGWTVLYSKRKDDQFSLTQMGGVLRGILVKTVGSCCSAVKSDSLRLCEPICCCMLNRLASGSQLTLRMVLLEKRKHPDDSVKIISSDTLASKGSSYKQWRAGQSFDTRIASLKQGSQW